MINMYVCNNKKLQINHILACCAVQAAGSRDSCHVEDHAIFGKYVDLRGASLFIYNNL